MVFVCIYNEASFPEIWEQLKTENFILDKINRKGAYLVRIVPRPGFSVTLSEVQESIAVTMAGDTAINGSYKKSNIKY
jgi:hypothetical protein